MQRVKEVVQTTSQEVVQTTSQEVVQTTSREVVQTTSREAVQTTLNQQCILLQIMECRLLTKVQSLNINIPDEPVSRNQKKTPVLLKKPEEDTCLTDRQERTHVH